MLSSEEHVNSPLLYRPLLSDLFFVLPVERPATKWPGIFENMPIFVTYPYLLPCAVAASVTFIGRILLIYG